MARHKPVVRTIPDVREAAPRPVASDVARTRAYPSVAEIAGHAGWRAWLDGALRTLLVPAAATVIAACGEPQSSPTVVPVPEAAPLTLHDGLGKPSNTLNILPPEKVGLTPTSAVPTPPTTPPIARPPTTYPYRPAGGIRAVAPPPHPAPAAIDGGLGAVIPVPIE